MLRLLTSYFGWFFVALASALSFLRLLSEQPIGHALTFAQAAQSLWAGQTPYSQVVAGNLYFYSPLCGLLLYGLLAQLPHLGGVLLYSFAGGAAFLFSLHRLSLDFLPDPKTRQWLYLLISPQLYAALFAFKTELFLLSGLFFSIHLIDQQKKLWLSAVLLALVTHFKLQFLPILALIVVWDLLSPAPRPWSRGHWSIIALITLGLGTLIPSIGLGWEKNLALHVQWLSSVQKFSSRSYFAFDNLFSFLENTLDADLTFSEAQLLTLTAASIIGFLSLILLIRRRYPFGHPHGLLWILNIGTLFTLNFSPLQQTNAYLLFAPVWITALYLWKKSKKKNDWVWMGVIAISAFFLFFGYSDLVPLSIRDVIRHGTWRPIFCDLLGCYVIFKLWNIDKAHSLT